jgi:hypothetical protein
MHHEPLGAGMSTASLPSPDSRYRVEELSSILITAGRLDALRRVVLARYLRSLDEQDQTARAAGEPVAEPVVAPAFRRELLACLERFRVSRPAPGSIASRIATALTEPSTSSPVLLGLLDEVVARWIDACHARPGTPNIVSGGGLSYHLMGTAGAVAAAFVTESVHPAGLTRCGGDNCQLTFTRTEWRPQRAWEGYRCESCTTSERQVEWYKDHPGYRQQRKSARKGAQ